MTARFFALLTNIGAAKLANATALSTRLEITHMAVGDGGGTLPTPNPAQTKLVNEQRRAALNMLTIDPINTSQIIAEQFIPETEGGWWIREIGLLDKDGDLVAIANCAETYKPQLQEGSGRTQTIRMILIVSSTAAVTLKIDPSVVFATRKYVDDKMIEVKQYADKLLSEHENSRNHPDASLTAKGFAKYSSAIDSNSETLAATSKAVKAAVEAAEKNLGDHGKAVNPHNQYFQIANLLSEIKALGPAALAETLFNLGLGDVQTMGARMVSFQAAGTFTFTVPAGVTRIRARVVGGGGGAGAGTDSSISGGGGGGGGYSESWITVTPGGVLDIVVGSGGSGGRYSGASGTNGGTSSVSYFLSASGGGGGWAGDGGSRRGGYGGYGTGGYGERSHFNTAGSDGLSGEGVDSHHPGPIGWGGGSVLGGTGSRQGQYPVRGVGVGGTCNLLLGGNGSNGAVILEY